ncbi:MAG: hypothetical protein R3302_02865 [Sulfurimonadaceae bacterium]|nr:hypothetical protein [Sulfurimonadaceae bacterium]
MHDKPIEIIEPTPKLKQKRCKALAHAIAFGLGFGPYIIAAYIWYSNDLFYGLASLLIAYLVIGIVRSKLRNSAIPLSQQEYHYTDRAIAAWFVSKILLCP